jgi:hypothetical protein
MFDVTELICIRRFRLRRDYELRFSLFQRVAHCDMNNSRSFGLTSRAAPVSAL